VANRFLKWEPVTELLREIYEGDVSLMNGRPLEWWGQEPFQATRQDWRTTMLQSFNLVGRVDKGGHTVRLMSRGQATPVCELTEVKRDYA